MQPKALYVHCTAHRFQLAVQGAMTAVREMRDAVGEAARLIDIFQAVTKAHDMSAGGWCQLVSSAALPHPMDLLGALNNTSGVIDK